MVPQKEMNPSKTRKESNTNIVLEKTIPSKILAYGTK